MRAAGVDSVAICFLHSYRNSVHEQEAAEMARSAFGAHAVSVSSEIAPEIKEYWRASTTCVNAYVGPVVRRYLGRVGEQLNARGFQGQVGIMHSGGGIESARSIVERPFQMIESGPAAGVAGAAFFARSLGYANAISFDMGGTTAKAGLILDGASRVLPEFEVAAAGGSGVGVAKASGHPILGEVVDLVEVGAGGGSLAWIDAGGHLRVGPARGRVRSWPCLLREGRSASDDHRRQPDPGQDRS
jgi:N-methylhydantoinase A/oxoprolinase/acetone carboxylase beta subunit